MNTQTTATRNAKLQAIKTTTLKQQSNKQQQE